MKNRAYRVGQGQGSERGRTSDEIPPPLIAL
jgi:hypothetical protein